jgi:hypothetical protein
MAKGLVEPGAQAPLDAVDEVPHPRSGPVVGPELSPEATFVVNYCCGSPASRYQWRQCDRS